MKRLMLLSAGLLLAAGSYAQSDDNAIFRFDNTSDSPKEISKLGTAPEFTFLRHKTTSRQVYDALKKHNEMNTPGMTHLNNMLMNIGFANGVDDLSASDITASRVAPGTVGNMGSAGYTSSYCKLSGDPNEFKAWKITGTSGYMYVMAKCGNAFYPQSASSKPSTACVTAPVNLTTQNSQITLNGTDQKVTTTDQVYVYYHLRHHKKHDMPNPNADIPDAYPSKALLLRKSDDVEVMPVTYNISVSPTQNTVSVCPDSTLNLAANINVEKSSEYSGYYPNKDKKEYRRVSKHKYKRIARNLRREERKERKVARLSGGIEPNV